MELAHIPDILLLVESMDDTACCQEQQALEESVSHEVEYACGQGPDSHSHHHVSKLAQGRIGQDAFDVILHQGNGCCQQGSQTAYCGDQQQGRGDLAEDEESPGQQVYTRCHHCSCMNQSTHRGRAFHCIRQPHMQGELG